MVGEGREGRGGEGEGREGRGGEGEGRGDQNYFTSWYFFYLYPPF